MWHKEYDRCQECGTIESPHRSLGLCNRCYARQYYAKNRERLTKLRQIRRQRPDVQEKERDMYKTPEGRKYTRERQRKWRKENPEKAKAIKDRFYEKNPNYRTEYSRRPEMKEYNRNYNLRKKYGENAFVVLERDNYTCQKCGSKDDIHIHHIDWNKENNELGNLILLCNSCHLTLHNFVPERFRCEIFDDFMQNVIND